MPSVLAVEGPSGSFGSFITSCFLTHHGTLLVLVEYGICSLLLCGEYSRVSDCSLLYGCGSWHFKNFQIPRTGDQKAFSQRVRWGMGVYGFIVAAVVYLVWPGMDFTFHATQETTYEEICAEMKKLGSGRDAERRAVVQIFLKPYYHSHQGRREDVGHC